MGGEFAAFNPCNRIVYEDTEFCLLQLGDRAAQVLNFRQALAQPGYPVLAVSTEVESGHLVIAVRQVQKRSWGLFRIPRLEIVLDDRTITVDVQGALTRVVTHWTGEAPRAVTVDPNNKWLLAVRGER